MIDASLPERHGKSHRPSTDATTGQWGGCLLLLASCLFALPSWLHAAPSALPLSYRLTEIFDPRLLPPEDIVAADRFDDGTTRLAGDDLSKAYTLPWPFPFYGRSYSRVGVDSNGHLWLGDTARTRPHIDLAHEGPVISPWSNDLDASASGLGVQVEHKTSPERVVFRWRTVTYCNRRDVNEFEAVLYPNGYILLRYLVFGNVSRDEGSGISAGNGTEVLDLTRALGPVHRLAGHGYLIEGDIERIAAGVDADHDGLEDGLEVGLGYDPASPDSDGDGVKDGWEYYLFGQTPATVPPLELVVPDVSIVEGGAGMKTARIVASLRNQGLHRPIRIDYRTRDVTATSGSDYVATNGSFVIASSQSSASIDIVVLGDAIPEPDETLRIELSSPDPGVGIVGGGGSLSIRDDDTDSDHDGVVDIRDNCLSVANPAQRDTDADGYGNLCDADFDNDGGVDMLDYAYFAFVFGGNDPALGADLDGDGRIDMNDYAVFSGLFGRPPGPSGLVP